MEESSKKTDITQHAVLPTVAIWGLVLGLQECHAAKPCFLCRGLIAIHLLSRKKRSCQSQGICSGAAPCGGLTIHNEERLCSATSWAIDVMHMTPMRCQQYVVSSPRNVALLLLVLETWGLHNAAITSQSLADTE